MSPISSLVRLADLHRRRTEERINKYANYMASLRVRTHEQSVHFTALFSEKKDAVPVLMLHGWPGESPIQIQQIVGCHDQLTTTRLLPRVSTIDAAPHLYLLPFNPPNSPHMSISYWLWSLWSSAEARQVHQSRCCRSVRSAHAGTRVRGIRRTSGRFRSSDSETHGGEV